MARNRWLVKAFTLLASVTLALLHASAQGRGPSPLGLPMESQTSQASIRSARSRLSSGRMRSREKPRSLTKRQPRSKSPRTRGSTGICSIPKRASRAPAMRRVPRAACCCITSSGTSAATS